MSACLRQSWGAMRGSTRRQPRPETPAPACLWGGEVFFDIAVGTQKRRTGTEGGTQLTSPWSIRMAGVHEFETCISRRFRFSQQIFPQEISWESVGCLQLHGREVSPNYDNNYNNPCKYTQHLRKPDQIGALKNKIMDWKVLCDKHSLILLIFHFYDQVGHHTIRKNTCNSLPSQMQKFTKSSNLIQF